MEGGGVPTRPPPWPPHLQQGLGRAGSAPERIALPGRGIGRGSRETEKRPTPGREGCRRAGRAPRRSGGQGRAAAQPGTLLRPGRGRDGGYATGDTTYSSVFLREEVGAVIQAFLLSRRARHTEGQAGKRETQRETLAPGPRRSRARRPHRAPRVRRRREHPPSWLLRVQGSRRRTSKATD